MKYYKFLDKDGGSPFQGAKHEAGVWLPPVEGELKICKNGYHFCGKADVAVWADDRMYEVEVEGDILHGDNKSCARSIRMTRIDGWNRTTQIMFGAKCAEQVLHLYEGEFPDDPRVRDAIFAARQNAVGLIDEKAMATARDAARGAAWAAAGAAQSKILLSYVADEKFALSDFEGRPIK